MSRELLISALSEAAEIEHGITCQYLFAAFSLKTHIEEGGVDWPALEKSRGWKAELLRIARQEMAHHGLVSNLLLVIGGAPCFGRADFPYPVRCCPPYATFELLPFSADALERFACYERLHASAPADPGAPSTAPAGSIGELYRTIRDVLERVYRQNPNLFIGPIEHQIENQDLRIRPGQFDVDLAAATDLRSALALLDRLREHDHHQSILQIQDELAELSRRQPSFAPARPVVANPCVRPARGPGDPATVLRHPLTRAASALFNTAYEVMVLMLLRIYGRAGESAAEVEGLTRTAFFPLMTAVIRPLGEILTQMPVAEDGAMSATAGPGFEFPVGLPLQPFKRSAWVLLHERLQEMAGAAERLSTAVGRSVEPWAGRVEPRVELLSENLARIAVNFEQQMNLGGDYLQHALRKRAR